MKVAALCAAVFFLGCGGTTAPDDSGGGGEAGIDAAPDATDAAIDELSWISAGNQYTCAVSRGRAVCWGLNLSGAVDGVGTATTRPEPLPIDGLPPIKLVVASALGQPPHTCAITADARLYCWGSNYLGQMGNGTATIPSTTATPPTWVSALPTAATVACGNGYTCNASSTGAVRCWGSAWAGQLGVGPGDGGPPPDEYSPTVIVGIPGATAIATDDRTTCAIAGGSVWCWGANDDGQVGDGTTTTRYTPVKLASLSNATSITVGDLHTCAVSTGQVYCWGSDDSGQLGDGKPQARSLVPVAVKGLTGVVSVTAGLVHTCALTQSGTVYCWGGNDFGALGDGTVKTERDTPVLVAGLPRATAISAGAVHTCALLATGGAMCWGDDTYGELGDGVADGGPRSVPTPVAVVGIP